MATLALGAAVSGLGLTGVAGVGAALAANVAGRFIDNALFGSGGGTSIQEGPRLQEIDVLASTEGAPVRRMFGRVRVGGNIIWAANFRENKVATAQSTGGGKGIGGGGSTQINLSYVYSLSFAVAFCEGNSRVTLGRMWADGELLDTEGLSFTFYPGGEAQGPDPTIQGIEGATDTPAYKGVTYVVFRDLPLEQFGNRVPQITAEIIKPLAQPEPDSAEDLIEGTNLIPSTGEAAYNTTGFLRDDGFGNSIPENLNLSANRSNISHSLENLVRNLPNNKGVNLVISWFGTDLRAGSCQIQPRVEKNTGRQLIPVDWLVCGLLRGGPLTNEVSQDALGNPQFGGTPSDLSVFEAIAELGNTRDQNIYFYPFLLMDIPPGNVLPDTQTGVPGQPVYPWRGRITTSTPAIDKTAAAQAEVDALFGATQPSDFTVADSSVFYTGNPLDFGYRRMILHYAHICAAAATRLNNPAKFKAFYVGTELRGLTRIRSTPSGAATSATVYPGVNALIQLMVDVRGIFDSYGLTGVELSYAADWSEYHSHRPDDGSGDVYFNMDGLWGHPACDYVAIDNYMKLSDWREGNAHADFGDGDVNDFSTTGPFGSTGFPQATSIYDLNYLKGQVEGGEDFHYFYLNETNRNNQVRTRIADLAHSEHWVFRQKDIRNWWGQAHRSRPGGTRDGSIQLLGGVSNIWTPSSKRIVFSEMGAPAVDFGTNEPNVFFDPKSSESFLPKFSRGRRDDYIQRVYYEAFIAYWRDNSPTSPFLMVSPSEMFSWTWDARPYPAFPFRGDIWSDAPNYDLGHWLNGRMGVLTLAQLVKEICFMAGLTEADIDVTGLVNSAAIVPGYRIDALGTPREILGPLMDAYLFDAFESGGKVRFQLRSNTLFEDVPLDDLVVADSGDNPGGYTLTRLQETELPAASSVTFIDERKDYQSGSVGGVRLVGESRVIVEERFPIVLDEAYARSLSEVIIQQQWSARDRCELRLPPSYLRLDPADGLTIPIGNRSFDLRVGRVERDKDLTVSTVSHDPTVFDTLTFSTGLSTSRGIPVFGRSILHIMDLPIITGDEPSPGAPRVSAYQSPFPQAVQVYNKAENDVLSLNSQVTTQAIMGLTTEPLEASDPFRIDRSAVMTVVLYDADAQLLGASSELEVLNGANAVAVQTTSGSWEVLQYVDAQLTGTNDVGLPVYELSGLLRGQLGTETEIEDPLPAGAQFTLLDDTTVFLLNLGPGQVTFELDYRFGPSNADPTGALFQDVTHTGKGTGLKPYAPAHLKKLDVADGVAFSWVRRTRFGGDDFDAVEVPLNEQAELYDVEILDPAGPTLLRGLTDLTSPSYAYTAAQQTADGGALGSYILRVWQKSALIGRGRLAEAIL